MFYLLFLSWSMSFSKYFSTHCSEYLTRLEMITFTTLKNDTSKGQFLAHQLHFSLIHSM